LERVNVSMCVSTGAPGAKEVSDFQRKMAAHFDDGKSEGSSRKDPGTLVLEKRSVLNFRLSDPSRDQVYGAASLLSQTRVNVIQLKQLPPETFEAPEGYSKLQNPSGGTAAADLPQACDQSINPAPDDLRVLSQVSEL